ncbi:hypothetical protein PHYPSEUDO_010075 [Phytophthora pseudosyringae]|uniref:HTH psq-type domain-containing protein n=1 Tax=Phytophthora pseudosyringae TaxID=221518 RepID=A0A8T1VB07_9STRA|nr:hypothetical protein PHYPSEUDO_010075 [Phytophthora pseudosyringae]
MPMQQPLGEFMTLHVAGNADVAFALESSSSSSTTASPATSAREGESMKAAAKAEDEAAGNSTPHEKQKKRVRYLCDTDRHNIIRRIDNGEKQAALAREYGVTRAAVCHIKKNREEIITRYDSLVKQAHEIDRAENFADPPGENLMVREIRSSSVLLLMTTLRDRRSGPATFRRAAGRLIMLLLEEALAVISAHAIEMTTATGSLTYGLERTDEFCGVAIGAEGFPLLVLFHQMEPDAPQGSIHVEQEVNQQGQSTWRLDHMDLPSAVTRYKVLLFSSTVNTGGAECKAIEALCSLGVQEDRITLVVLLCSTDSLVAICTRFPGRVRVITGAIDSKVDPQTQAIIPGLGDFVARYLVEAGGDCWKITMDANVVLLQAVAGVARAVRSLYGPNKLRKQVTDELDQTLFSADAYTVASALQSQNAGTAILQQALDAQRNVFGTGCTTMVTLCGVLAEAALELQRQGLQAAIVQQAMSSVELCCLETARHMRVPLAEVVPSFQMLTWPRQLATLGQILATSNRSIATTLAVRVASALDPIRFCGEEHVSLQELVTTHVVLGGVTSATSSRVLDGVLLPVAEDSHRNALRRKMSLAVDGTISIDGGVVILAGDLDTTDFTTDSSVQVIFVHGSVNPRVIDASESTSRAPLCIPVLSYNSLRQLAEMSGAEIVDSWEELLPSAVGRECLQVNALDLSVSRAQDNDDDDELAAFFMQVVLRDATRQPHVSVIVQGPTKSLAVELRNELRTMLCRLRNALRSGNVLPGNGGFWCACAAAVAQEAETLATSNQELLSFATSRLADPLIQLGVILLENSGGCNPNDVEADSFFSRLARVRTVQKRFARSVQDVGASKFYSRYFDFRSTEYAVLSSNPAEPESEDGRFSHADEHKSTSSAIRGGFRVIQLLLNIERHHVN